MKSKASYFSISMPLIKENLRRFWAIPALAFLVYFLSGIFPILMSYKSLNFMARYIEMSLHNIQPFFMGAHLLMPVITAVILLRYLQNVSSVAVMHSMPFTRAKLYNSNFISGLILISVPVVLNGIIMLLLSKPVFQQWGYGDEVSFSTINVFSRGEILNWMGTSLIILIVLFSVSIFAGIVTGNNLMHLFTSYFFIFLIPLLYAVFNVYFQEFLFGFDPSGDWIKIALDISPYTGIISRGGYFPITAVLFYLATIAVMLVVSAVLYNKRKLERATDSMTFNFMKPIICYVIAFLGMTMLGFYFQILGDGRLYMYAGFAAGTLIFFIIGQMIVVKSPRIYNKEGLKNFIAYALIAIVFIVGLNFDVTGFEKRTPNPKKVNSIYLSEPFNMMNMLNRYRGEDEKGLTDKENIEALAEFHRSILENRNRFEGQGNHLYTSGMRIGYDIKGFFNMNRRYIIDYAFCVDSPQLKKIFESKEYKERNSFKKLGVEKYVRANFYSDVIVTREKMEEKDLTDPALLDQLIANIEKDFANMSYEDLISLRPSYANIELEYIPVNKETLSRKDSEHIYFNLPMEATNTIKWLKDKGFDFQLSPDMVEWVEIYEPKHLKMGATGEASSVMPIKEYDYAYKFGGQTVLAKITSKEEIAKVLSNYDTSAINYDTAYEITIAYRLKDGDRIEYNSDADMLNYIHGYINGSLDFLD